MRGEGEGDFHSDILQGILRQGVIMSIGFLRGERMGLDGFIRSFDC